jgi:thiol:disulfide interchange protein
MKIRNEDIDQLIKEALTDDEQALFSAYDEQNMLQKFGGLFQGKMKWLNAMGMIIQFIMFGLAVYLGYRFFNTTDVTEMIQFGFGTFLLMMAVTGIKFFQFLEINKNEVIREVKRMELQLSLLAGKLKE